MTFHSWSCYNIKSCMQFIPKLHAWWDTTFTLWMVSQGHYKTQCLRRRQWGGHYETQCLVRGYYLSVIIWAWALRTRLRKRDFHGDLELEIPTRNHCKDRNTKITVNTENTVNKNLVGFKSRQLNVAQKKNQSSDQQKNII